MKIFFSVIIMTLAFYCSFAQAVKETDLIPREVIFGNNQKTDAQISPDGQWVSYLAKHNKVTNLWLAPITNLKAAHPITNSKQDVFFDYYWAQDSKHLIFLGDNGGDENFSFHSVNIETKKTQLLSPNGKNIRTQFYASSLKHPKHIILGFNNRTPSKFNLYKVNIESGKRELIYQNDKAYDRFYFDEDLKLKIARLPVLNSPYYEVHKINDNGNGKMMFTISMEESRTYQILEIDQNGKHFYALDNKESNFTQLIKISLKSGKRKLIVKSDKVDIKDVIFDPKTKQPIAYAEEYQFKIWKDLKGKTIKFPTEYKGERIDFLSSSSSGKLRLACIQGKKADRYCIVKELSEIQELFYENEALLNYEAPNTFPITITTRDGLEMVTYITLPPGCDKNGDGIPDKPMPTILNPHDGPWKRNSFFFDPWWHWLSNRGYVVVSPNFRGSTGFGKDFLNAGNMEWGGKMQDDLMDAVEYITKNGISDPNKIGILGASYSGYAALMGLAKDGDKFTCAIDMFGPSNIETLLNSLPKYWMAEFEEIVMRMGDPRTEEGRKFLKERSPLTYTEQIKKPLFIIQGENDVRVKRQESDQIANALHRKNIPVTYWLVKNGGHGWFSHENSMAIFYQMEKFLSENLGGRYQKQSNEIEKADIDVIFDSKNNKHGTTSK